MNEYRERLKVVYPDYTDEQIEELIELRVNFWRWMIQNFDKFFDIDSLK